MRTRGKLQLIFLSIIASLLSVVSKFGYNDVEFVIDEAATAHLQFFHRVQTTKSDNTAAGTISPQLENETTGYVAAAEHVQEQHVHSKGRRVCRPYISPSYLMAKLFRFCESLARFGIFTLIWAVIGGLYLPLYLLLDWCLYFVLEAKTGAAANDRSIALKGKEVARMRRFQLLYSLQTVVGIPIRRNLKMHVFRLVDNCLVLGAAFAFAFVDFQCFACYNKPTRNASYNPYVLVFVITTSICALMSFLIYLGLHKKYVVQRHRSHREVQVVGMSNILICCMLLNCGWIRLCNLCGKRSGRKLPCAMPPKQGKLQLCVFSETQKTAI